MKLRKAEGEKFAKNFFCIDDILVQCRRELEEEGDMNEEEVLRETANIR